MAPRVSGPAGVLADRRILLVGVILASAGLRFYNLASESLWLDEIYSVRYVAVRNVVEVISDTFQTDFHPFLYYVFLDGWVALFGSSDWTCRSLSAITGVLSVIASYGLAKTAFRSESVALLSAFLVAVSPVHIRYSQEVRMYVLLLLFWPILLHFLYRCWHTRYRFWPSLGAIASFTAFAYSHAMSGLFALPVVCCASSCFIARRYRSREKKGMGGAFWVSALCLAAYVPWMLRLPALQASGKSLKGFHGNDVSGLFQWLLLSGEHLALPQLPWILAWVVLAAMLRSWRSFMQDILAPSAAFIISTAIVVGTQCVLSVFRECYQAKNLVFLLIPLLILAALWIVRYVESAAGPATSKTRTTALLVWAVIPSLAFVVALIYTSEQQMKFGYYKEQWREAAFQVRTQVKNGDVIGFYGEMLKECWDHYDRPVHRTDPAGGGMVSDLSFFRISRTKNENRFQGDVEALVQAAWKIGDGNSVWVFYSHVSDPEKLHSRLERSGLYQLSSWSGYGVVVGRYVLVKR